MKKYSSAIGLAWELNQVGLLKNKIWQKTASEKLNYIERLVMATRYRMLTIAEKNSAVNAIQQNGVVYTSYMYLINWYYSTYYKKHFDYGKKASPFYLSYIVSGKFVTPQNQNIGGVKYVVPIEMLAGYVLEGVTSANGDYDLQVFQPLTSIFADKPLVVNAAKDSLKQTYVRSLSFPIVIGLKLTFTGTQEAPSANETWPRASIARNPQTESLGFSTWGDGLICQKPIVMQPSGIVNPVRWQRYVDCLLNTQQSRYPSLLERVDALIYLQIAFSNYLNSNAAIYKSDLENLGLLFSAMAFRNLTATETNSLKTALVSATIDSVASDMLLSWYYSSAYNKFDFSKEESFSKRNIRVRGTVLDESGTPVNGILISLVNNGALVANGISTNGIYDFIASIEETNPLTPRYELQASSPSHSNKAISVAIAANQTEITSPFILPFLNRVTPTAGGEARLNDGSVSVSFPPGAVSASTTFQITPMTTESFAGGMALKFEVTPSYSFSQDVRLSVKIPNGVIASLVPDATLLAATPRSDGTWELLSGLTWRSKNGVSENYEATTRHFSYIYFLPSNLLTCQFIDGTQKIICQTSMAIPGISPLAEITQRRTWIEVPSELPSLRTYAKGLLKSRGWNGDLFDNLSNFDLTPFAAVNISAACFDNSCQYATLSADQIQYNYPGLVLSNKSAQGRAWVDGQAEHCAANPAISFSQGRVNSVQATDLQAGTNFSLSTSDGVYCSQRRCTKILWWTACTDLPGSCTFNYQASGRLQISRNEPLAKVAANDWRTIAGGLTTDLSPPFISDSQLVNGASYTERKRYTDYANDQLKSYLKSASDQIGFATGDQFRLSLNNVNAGNPEFSPDTCYVTSPNSGSLTYNGTFAVNGFAYQSYVNNGIAYVAAGNDCTNYPGPGGLRILNVNGQPPGSELGYFFQDAAGGSFPGFTCTSSIALDNSLPLIYVADIYNGLQVLNVSNPSMPILQSNVSGGILPNGAWDIKIRGTYTYVAGFDRLAIINISNPAAPSLSFGFSTGNNILTRLALNERYVFLVQSNGVQILDAGNTASPSNPVSVGVYTPGGANPSGIIQDIVLMGGYAYVSQDNSGITILDITNLANPRALYNDTSASHPRGMFVDTSSKKLFVADLSFGLRVFDIANPVVFLPVASAQLQPSGTDGAQAVFVAGNQVYLSAGSLGLQRFTFTGNSQ